MTIKETKCTCSVQFIGTLPENYAKSSEQDLKHFSYENSISMTFVYSVDTSGNKDSLNKDDDGYTLPYNTSIHIQEDTLDIDQFEIESFKDGYYKIESVIIPTKEFIDTFLNLEVNTTAEQVLNYLTEQGYSYKLNSNCLFIVAYDLETNCFKQLTVYGISHKMTWETISIYSIIDALESGYEEQMTIMYENQDYFSYCLLYNCFIQKALNMLNIYTGSGDSSNSTLSSLCSGSSVVCDDNLKKYKTQIQIRDYLWMAINTIKYLIECGNYLKALRVLNCVQTCSGICSSTTTSTTTSNSSSNGCGCS